MVNFEVSKATAFSMESLSAKLAGKWSLIFMHVHVGGQVIFHHEALSAKWTVEPEVAVMRSNIKMQAPFCSAGTPTYMAPQVRLLMAT